MTIPLGPRILAKVRLYRFPLAAPGSLLLAAALAWAGAVPSSEALASGVALACCALLANGLSGLRRLGADLSLLPAAYVLTLTSDPIQRLMLFQALLAMALSVVLHLRRDRLEAPTPGQWALAAAAPVLSALPVLEAKFGWGAAFALSVPFAGWVLGKRLGFWSLPLIWLLFSPKHPGVVLGLLLSSWLLSRESWRVAIGRVARRWAVPLLASGLGAAVLLPWGGPLTFPSWTLPAHALGMLVVLLLLTPFLKPALAAALWAWGAWFLLPLGPTPPDHPGPTLTATAPVAELPKGEPGSLYLLEVALANSGLLPEGTPVADLEVAGTHLPLRAGRDTAEWAALREDVAQTRAHPLPKDPVFRPSHGAPWAVAGRLELFVPPGESPRVTRHPSLPQHVTVALLQAGPSTPTPKRSWDAARFLLFALVAVTVFSLGFFGHLWAFAPFALLAFAKLWLWLPLQPSRILMERYGVDVALMSLLLAWGLAFRRSLTRRSLPFPSLVLLAVFALWAPRLGPLAGDEPYHLALAESLKRDGDLDITNNVDSQQYPRWVVDLAHEAKGRFLHSPVLALLLFPGYLVGKRAGMVAGVTLLAWLSLVALGARAKQLRFSPQACFLGLLLTLGTYPFLLFAVELWPEMPAAAAVSWQLLWVAQGAFWPSALVALVSSLIKTRLGLITVPLAGAALLTKQANKRRLFQALALAGVVGVIALGVAALWFGNPLDPLGRRALGHLIPRDVHQPLRVVFGFLFDSAYGITFAAPLWLGAFFGLPHLWRRGGPGEKVGILGGAATVAALLSYVEWRGGGSPPFRYLVVFFPLVFLSLLASWRKPAGRALTLLALPPSVLVSWVAFTRPGLLYNIGDGGQWLADRLAGRLAADARHLFPSYLRLSPASWWAPVVLVLLCTGLWFSANAQPRLRRWLCRQTVGLWLAAAAALVVTARWLPDQVVELEDPQVQHLGGALEPHPGTWTRFLYPNGWRLTSGDGVTVPLHLPANRGLILLGWVEGSGGSPCALLWSFTSENEGTVTLPTDFRNGLALPAPPAGRVTLSLRVTCPESASVVLDRLEVQR